MTQLELAEALNISQTAVSKYERGVCEPDLSVVIAWRIFSEFPLTSLSAGFTAKAKASAAGKNKPAYFSDKFNLLFFFYLHIQKARRKDFFGGLFVPFLLRECFPNKIREKAPPEKAPEKACIPVCAKIPPALPQA